MIKIKEKTMKKLKTVIFLSMLVILPLGAGADIGSPTGTGKLTVTNISIGSQGTTFDFEGSVENYNCLCNSLLAIWTESLQRHSNG